MLVGFFERLLREREHGGEQAKDRFGEHTSDAELIKWSGEYGTILLTNNAKDFESLHDEHDYAGILLYYDQKLPNTDPERLARTVDEVFNQYGSDGVDEVEKRLDQSRHRMG